MNKTTSVWDIPDHREELNRKVVETLQLIEQRHDTGFYSTQDRIIALDTINEICLGLIDSDISEVISDTLVEIKTDFDEGAL